MSPTPSPDPSNPRAKGNPAEGYRFGGRAPQPSQSDDCVRIIVRYCGELLVDLIIRLPAPPPWPDGEQGIGGGR